MVFINDEFAIGAVGVFEAAEGELAGCMIAGSAGKFPCRVLFARALCATIDMEPDDGATRVDKLLREVKRVKGVRVRAVAKLPNDGGDLVVGSVGRGDKGQGVIGLVEELER